MQLEAKNKSNRVYYTVEYDQVSNHIYGNWVGFVTVEEVKEACLIGLSLLEKHRCPYMLNDNSQITGPWSGANEWIATVWMPRALAAGLKRFAHVVSPNVFAAMSVEQLVTRVEGLDFEMQIFQSKHQAQEWLQKEPVPTLGE